MSCRSWIASQGTRAEIPSCLHAQLQPQPLTRRLSVIQAFCGTAHRRGLETETGMQAGAPNSSDDPGSSPPWPSGGAATSALRGGAPEDPAFRSSEYVGTQGFLAPRAQTQPPRRGTRQNTVFPPIQKHQDFHDSFPAPHHSTSHIMHRWTATVRMRFGRAGFRGSAFLFVQIASSGVPSLTWAFSKLTHRSLPICDLPHIS